MASIMGALVSVSQTFAQIVAGSALASGGFILSMFAPVIMAVAPSFVAAPVPRRIRPANAPSRPSSQLKSDGWSGQSHSSQESILTHRTASPDSIPTLDLKRHISFSSDLKTRSLRSVSQPAKARAQSPGPPSRRAPRPSALHLPPPVPSFALQITPPATNASTDFFRPGPSSTLVQSPTEESLIGGPLGHLGPPTPETAARPARTPLSPSKSAESLSRGPLKQLCPASRRRKIVRSASTPFPKVTPGSATSSSSAPPVPPLPPLPPTPATTLSRDHLSCPHPRRPRSSPSMPAMSDSENADKAKSKRGKSRVVTPAARTQPYAAPYFFPAPGSPQAADYVRLVREERRRPTDTAVVRRASWMDLSAPLPSPASTGDAPPSLEAAAATVVAEESSSTTDAASSAGTSPPPRRPKSPWKAHRASSERDAGSGSGAAETPPGSRSPSRPLFRRLGKS